MIFYLYILVVHFPFQIILNGTTKIEIQCDISGTVNGGLAIGDKNIVAKIENVTLDKHQSRGNCYFSLFWTFGNFYECCRHSFQRLFPQFHTTIK